MFLARCVLSLSAQRAPCSSVGGIQGPEFFLTLTQTRLPSEGCGGEAGFHTGSTGMVPKEAPSILHPITDVHPLPPLLVPSWESLHLTASFALQVFW